MVAGGWGKSLALNSHGSNSDVAGMERVMRYLDHKLLNGEKVLLVLDDLWEEDSIQLQRLKSMLTFFGDKIIVIVTTSNQAIARKICTGVQPYRLNPLSDDTCLEIIKKLFDFQEDEELKKIGRIMAVKCRGVPLAAVEYASMLVAWQEAQGPTKWEKVLADDLWDRSEALKRTFYLSYMSMPPALRLCCDYYCDIFPGCNSVIRRDLVHIWIALDLVCESGRSSAMEIAEGYITRLLDMSFLQTAKSGAVSMRKKKKKIGSGE
jgi:hypothetical protein